MQPISSHQITVNDLKTAVVLLGIIWLAGVISQAGALMVLVESDGLEFLFSADGARYLADLKRGVSFANLFWLSLCFLIRPRWSWVVFAFMLVVIVGLELQTLLHPSELLSAPVLIASAVPALLYGLGLSIAIRHRSPQVAAVG